MRQNYKELKLKSDEELYELMLSDQPDTFDYQVCLHLLQLRDNERLIRKTWALAIATWALVAATIITLFISHFCPF
jgi:hypothetical protein